jgi:hypothetical protein
MTRSEHSRRISIRSVRKDPPDFKKLGRALIALAMAQAEAEAQAEAARTRDKAEEDIPRPEDAK